VFPRDIVCLRNISTLHKGDDDDDNNNNNNVKTAGVANGRGTNSYSKNENTERQKNYRPATCLPTMYKPITSITSKGIEKYTVDKNLMPKEQIGCCRGSKGCKDQQLLSTEILH